MKFDQFVFEDDIYKVWNSLDDLRMVLHEYYDGKEIMTIDQLFNAMDGTLDVAIMKLKKVQDDFERAYQLNDYAPDDVKALREAILNPLKKEVPCQNKPKTKKSKSVSKTKSSPSV